MAAAGKTAVAMRTAALGDVLRVATLGERGSDGFHRSWIMLFPEGEFEHEQYGKLHFTKRRLGEIKANFDRRVRHIDIALDANHDQDKATGWLERVELRDGGTTDAQDGHAVPPGLWGLVRWTPLGQQLLSDQIYRYFSPEFGPWTDPETGATYKDVLIGGGLTNRPFLKKMPAVQLAEVSMRPWSQVDRSCLPDASFLDPKNRRLPIYEGAGPKDADGRYTKRGKLNINAVKAALAAVHGARSGKPMAGLPAGTAATLGRLMARYGRGGDGGGDSAKASEGGMVGDDMAAGTRKQQGQRGGGKSLADELFEKPGTADLDGDGEYDLAGGDAGMQFGSGKGKSGGMKSSKSGGKSRKADDGDGDADAGDSGDQSYDDGAEGDELDDDSDGATYDDGAEGDELDDSGDGTDGDVTMDDDDELEDTPSEGTSGRAASKRTGGHSQRTMPATKSKTASEGRRMERGESGGRMTLAEMQSEIIRLRERDAEQSFRLYERDVEDQLRRWERGEAGVPGGIALSENGKRVAGGKRAPLALSRAFKEGFRALMLREGYKLTERQRNGVTNLLTIALKDAVVDLSTRGSSFDQEARRTVRATDRRPASPDQSDRLQEHVERLAQSEGKVLSELGEAQLFALYRRAEEEIDYR